MKQLSKTSPYVIRFHSCRVCWSVTWVDRELAFKMMQLFRSPKVSYQRVVSLHRHFDVLRPVLW